MTESEYTTEPIVRAGLANTGDKNITPEYIAEAIRWASSDCDLYSGKNNWQTGDLYYPTIRGCAVQLAIAYSVAILNGKDVRELQEFKMAIQRLQKLNEELINLGIVLEPEATGGTEFIPPTTYPENPFGETIYAARYSRIMGIHENLGRATSLELID